MKIKFLKPAPGYAYSEGMVGDLSEEMAQDLIDKGYAKNAESVDDFDLPEDFPLREKLIEEGFGKMEDLKANIEAIKKVEGIGEKTYEKIVERLNQ